MFKVLHNRARLEIEIDPVTPLLIKAGEEGGLDPTLPQMQFVRTHSDLGPVVVIPGSSLKGVIRSQAERVLRTVDETKACDPLDRARACGAGRPRDIEAQRAYRELCLACRTFGSPTVAGRVRVTDALPWSAGMSGEERRQAFAKVRTEVRSGVAIDRRRQSARRGQLFELEVVSAGRFYGELFLTNFQLWQLALVGMSLRDIDEGYQQLGMGKTRGLGRVRCRVPRATLDFFGDLARDKTLQGVGKVAGLVQSYGVLPDDECPVPAGARVDRHGPCLKVSLEGPEAWTRLVDVLVAAPCCKVLGREKIGDAGNG